MHVRLQKFFSGLVLCLCLGSCPVCSAQEPVADLRVWMTETFDSLDQWELLIFPKIKRHTVYSIASLEIVPGN